MAVISVVTNATTGTLTIGGADGMIGSRLIIALCDRSGGVISDVTSNDPALTAALTFVESEVTLSSDANNRRSLFVWEAIIPPDVAQGPIVNAVVEDASAVSVTISMIAIVVEEGSSYSLISSAKDNSGTIAVASQNTGTTAVAEGGILLLTFETTRGDTISTWTTSTHTPPNPGGGNWDMSVGSGSGSSRRRESIGYYTEADTPSQTWDDTVSYTTSRTSSAIVLVYSTAGAPGGDISGTFDVEGLVAEASFEGTVTSDISGTLGATAPAVQASFTANIVSGEVDPILVGDGSLADRIMAGLISQGFTEGTLADRERARLLAKLVLVEPQNLSIQDLYSLANEENRLAGATS